MPQILLYPDLSVDPILLAFIGFAVGTVGSFVGVGGGYMVTPALVILGFPAHLAVGTDITHIVGKALVATLRHRRLGNVDFKLGLCMAAGTMAGTEIGVNLVTALNGRGCLDVVVLSCSVCVMLGIALLGQWEVRRAGRLLREVRDDPGNDGTPTDICALPIARRLQAIQLRPIVHFPRSGLSLSIWVIIATGLVTGCLAGFLGVGGGFVRVPALVYLIGQPTMLAVGTDLFEIVISAGYGCVRHATLGNVILPAALIMLLGASVGAHIGSAATQYVNGPALRRVLSWSVMLAALGALLRLAYLLTGTKVPAIAVAAKAFTLGEIALLVSVVVGLYACGVLAARGKRVPAAVTPFLLTPVAVNPRLPGPPVQ